MLSVSQLCNAEGLVSYKLETVWQKAVLAGFLRLCVGICLEEVRKPHKIEVKWRSYSVLLSELNGTCFVRLMGKLELALTSDTVTRFATELVI